MSTTTPARPEQLGICSRPESGRTGPGPARM